VTEPSRRSWKALLAGVALVLLPALAIGLHELAYRFEDWPCSSLNVHLRLNPWLRAAVHAVSLGCLFAAGRAIQRGQGLGLAAAFAVAALAVQLPASYCATRSGCGGAISQGPLLWQRDEDPGCREEACFCGVERDPLGRPVLLRAGREPLRLWAPAWLLDATDQQLRSALVHQEGSLLPVERCGR